MKGLRILVPMGFAVLACDGCCLHLGSLKCTLRSSDTAWETSGNFADVPEARYSSRMAEVTIGVSLADPYNPVWLRLRPAGAASVSVSRSVTPAGLAGAWRLSDREGRYLETRIPRPIAFGESLHVPEGADLLVYFDPGTVTEDHSISKGDLVTFDVRIEIGNESEIVPVQLEVVDTYRYWAIELIST